MHDAAILAGLRRKYEALLPILDERARRHWAAAEALELGWGGISALARATGLAAFAQGADLLYTEGQYTRVEYEGRAGVAGDPPLSRRGWGHSPVEACVATAVAAGVRALHVGHRDPRRSDAQIAQVDDYVRELMREELRRVGRPADSCRALIPYEGLRVYL